MIGYRNDQVKGACRLRRIAGSSLPDVCRQPVDVGPDFMQLRLHIVYKVEESSTTAHRLRTI